MNDIGYWLDRKYSNFEKDTASTAGLRGAQAGVYGQQAEAGRLANIPGQLMEQEALPGARQYMQDANRLNPAAGFGLLTGRSDFTAAATPRRQVTGAIELGTTPSIGSITKRPSIFSDDKQGFNQGTAKVMKKGETRVTDESGNGHPQVDTVPAMLAEGEAVLNAGAAERMGRDNIKALNKQGLRDMKMDDNARPVIKKGGRLGAFSGVEMAKPKVGVEGYANGTSFARTSPDNDAEYHPAEYSEPRDPEHDAEHMAQPLSSGGQGFGLRCGTAKVMKYSDGTSDVGGHGTPDSEGAVNMAGTAGGRGRNIGAKFIGARGYARGVADVPSESDTEVVNFERQRDRNQINEAMPYGVPVADEPAGEAGAVTPSRNTARLREQFGLTAQGFAMGTEDVKVMQMPQDSDTVYAAVGWEDVKGAGSRAAAGLRGMFSSAPVDLGTVGSAQAAPAPAPTPAPAAASPMSAAASDIASKQASATQAARMAMGEGPVSASQALRGGAGMAPAAAPTMSAAAPTVSAAPAGGGGMAYQTGQAVGKAGAALRGAGVGAVPLIGGAITAGAALNQMNDAGGFYNDPNVPAMDKAAQTLRTFGRNALPYVGGAIGSGIAPVAGTVGGAALGGLAASRIDAEGDALKAWRAKQPAAAAAPAAPGAAQGKDQAKAVADLDAYKRAAAEAAAADAKRLRADEMQRAGLRGLATMGTLMGSAGSQAALKDLSDREVEFSRTALARATKAGDDATKWSEGLGKGMFTRLNDKGVPELDPATESDFRRYALDRLSEQGVNVTGLTPKQKVAVERDMLDEFNNMRVVQGATGEHSKSLSGKLFGGVDPRGRVTPIGRVDNLSAAGSLTQPYSILQGLNPMGTKGVKVRDAAGNEFYMAESDYTKSQSTGLREPLRQQAVKDLPLVK